MGAQAGAEAMPGLMPQLGYDESIDLLIRKAGLLLDSLDRRTLATLSPPLTVAQYHALVALWRAPEQSLGDLAVRLLCAKANASGIVNRLEALGLASRRRDPGDARRVALCLTPAGRALLDRALHARAAALLQALAPAELHGLTTIVQALRRLIGLLEEADAEDAAPAPAGTKTTLPSSRAARAAGREMPRRSSRDDGAARRKIPPRSAGDAGAAAEGSP